MSIVFMVIMACILEGLYVSIEWIVKKIKRIIEEIGYTINRYKQQRRRPGYEDNVKNALIYILKDIYDHFTMSK